MIIDNILGISLTGNPIIETFEKGKKVVISNNSSNISSSLKGYINSLNSGVK